MWSVSREAFLISRKWIGVVLKVCLGAGILTVMALTGKMDLARIGRSLAQWPLMLCILGLGYAQLAVVAFRWNFLLRTQALGLPFSRAWSLTMIGILFNAVIPGGIGGDLVKGYYLSRANPGRKTHAAMTLVMDRATGLAGLFLVGGIMVLVNWHEAARSAATRSLAIGVMAGAVAGIAGIYAAVRAGGRVSQWSFLPAIARNAFGALHEYQSGHLAIPVALVLSALGQAMTCGMYYLALRATGDPGLPAGQFFLIVPLGLVTSAVPISPAGLGVGQAAFFALFRIVSPNHATAGTDALTVLQVLLILLSASGLFWYISGTGMERPACDKDQVEMP